MSVVVIKGVIHLNGRALILSIEQFFEVLSLSILDLLALHRTSICSILHAFALVDILCLPLSNLGHLIDIPFAFLRA